jgi:serine protease Do
MSHHFFQIQLRILHVILWAFLGFIFTIASAEASTRAIPSKKEEITLSFAPIVRNASPAVVNIYTKRTVQVKTSPLFNDPFFSQFFGQNLLGDLERERVESSLGSGVIVTPGGLVITNSHVIGDKETEITVVLSDRREFNATIALQDSKADLALLRIQGLNEQLPYLELGDSDDLEVGDMVLAIGNPFGVGQTVTSGIVSALARTTVGISDYRFFIQTDAAINPGNSGGAVVDMHGKVIGINTAIYSRSGGSNGIGFATPSNMVQAVIKSRELGGIVVRPWLGAEMQNVTHSIASSLGMNRPTGAIITKVFEGGPAHEAGIKQGDVILAVDGHDVIDAQALRFRMATLNIGAHSNFLLLRNGTRTSVPVKMLPPPEKPERDLKTLSGSHPLDGSIVGNLSPALADEMGVDIFSKGVIITEIIGGVAARVGLRRGDIIVDINDITISNSRQLEKTVATQRKIWVVTFIRSGRKLTISVR